MRCAPQVCEPLWRPHSAALPRTILSILLVESSVPSGYSTPPMDSSASPTVRYPFATHSGRRRNCQRYRRPSKLALSISTCYPANVLRQKHESLCRSRRMVKMNTTLPPRYPLQSLNLNATWQTTESGGTAGLDLDVLIVSRQGGMEPILLVLMQSNPAQ